MSNKTNSPKVEEVKAPQAQDVQAPDKALAEALKAKAKIRRAAANLAVKGAKLATRSKMRPELKESLRLEAETLSFEACDKAGAPARLVAKEMALGLEEAREMMRESEFFAFWYE